MSAPRWKGRSFVIWTGQTLWLVGSALVALIWSLTSSVRTLEDGPPAEAGRAEREERAP